MSEHLSSRQIDEWVIGQRTPRVEEHLVECKLCAGELQRISGPLQLFGSAMRNWGEQAELSVPCRMDVARPAGWRWALVAAALIAIIAVPIYRIELDRRDQMARQAALTTVQDEMLLRRVESGISRSVPAPMEPLAKLMWSN